MVEVFGAAAVEDILAVHDPTVGVLEVGVAGVDLVFLVRVVVGACAGRALVEERLTEGQAAVGVLGRQVLVAHEELGRRGRRRTVLREDRVVTVHRVRPLLRPSHLPVPYCRRDVLRRAVPRPFLTYGIPESSQ